MTAQPNTQADPFAGSESKPSVSFKDTPVGTSYTLEVTEAPQLVQARDYESGQPAFWPDGNPKMTVVTGVVDTATGEEKNLWAAKPSALFRAIGEAQKTSGSQIKAGDTLVVTFSGEKPNEKNPRLNPQKLYTVAHTPGNPFGGDTAPAGQPQAAPAPQAQQPAAPTQDAPAPQWTPEQIAAAQAAGITLPGM